MINRLAKLYQWLNKNSLSKEAAGVLFIVKLANEIGENKLFDRYQKLESMFLAAEKSDNQGIRTEGETAKRMAEKLKAKFKKITGKDFETEYLNWKIHNSKENGAPEEYSKSEEYSKVYPSYYQPKATYPKYDWRNYYNEMEELLRGFYQDPGLVTPSTEVGMQGGPSPGQYEARLDHIVGDFLDGNLSEEQANKLLDEGDSEWLSEMASEMRAERALTGYYQAQEREAQETEALGHPSWMSPSDLIEMEEREFESDWRNHIEAEGVENLLYTLNYDKREDINQSGLVKSRPSSLVRIQKDPYSEATMVKREDLLSPDAQRGNHYYGVTKLEYAKEYMQKQLDEAVYPSDYSSFNEEMDNLVKDTEDLFFRFQNYESEESVGGNDLADHLRDHLNNKSKDIAKQIEVLYNHIWKKITPDRYRIKRKIEMPYFEENWSRNFYSNRIKALLRYLNDVELESAGKPMSRAYKALLLSKYPYAYYSDNLENIHKELYEYAVPLDRRKFNEEELRAEYSEFLENLKGRYRDTFESCLPNI